MAYARGDVVKGPDPFGASRYRPWVCLTDRSHPFIDQEGLFSAVTTTERSVAIELTSADFASGGLSRKSYTNPWTVVTIKNADISKKEGELIDSTTDAIASAAAGFIGVP